MPVSASGVATTPLSSIMAQATIILITCSIVLSLLRDLYEDQKVQTGTGKQRKTVTGPLLVSTSANRLRWFLRWFVVALTLHFAILALSILAIEITPGGPDDVFIMHLRGGWKVRYAFDDVHTYASRAHFIIVVVVGMIVACTARVRDQEARQRWKQEPQ